MNRSTTIHQMIAIYNKIYGIITPNDLTTYESELNQCFNENLKRLYKTTKNQSEEFCCACLSNLRRNNRIDEIIAELSAIQGAPSSQTVIKIRTALMHFIDATCDILQVKPNQCTTMRIKTVVKYYRNMKVLQKYGFKKTDAEKRLEKVYKLAKLMKSIDLDAMDAKDVNRLTFDDYYRVWGKRKLTRRQEDFLVKALFIIIISAVVIILEVVGLKLLLLVGAILALLTLL